jgi:hypothetical protein
MNGGVNIMKPVLNRKNIKFVPKELWTKLKILALKKGIGLNDYLLKILKKEVEKEDAK